MSSSFKLCVVLSDSVTAKWQQIDGMWSLCLCMKHSYINGGKQTKHRISLTTETCNALFHSGDYITHCINGIRNESLKSPQKVFLHSNISLNIKRFWGTIYTGFNPVIPESVPGQEFILNVYELLNLVKLIERQLSIIQTKIQTLKACDSFNKTSIEHDLRPSESDHTNKQLFGIVMYGWQWIRMDLETFLKIKVRANHEMFCDPKRCLRQAEENKPGKSKYILNIFRSVKYKLIDGKIFDAALAKLIWLNIELRIKLIDYKEKKKSGISTICSSFTWKESIMCHTYGRSIFSL